MNAIYSIDCTGDAVVGDDVCFERAMFGGSFRKPKFLGNETVTGKIVRDSYGSAKQQHTFTIELPNGETTQVKGRNLYRNGCRRKPWADEAARALAIQEKHARGDSARRARELRQELTTV